MLMINPIRHGRPGCAPGRWPDQRADGRRIVHTRGWSLIATDQHSRLAANEYPPRHCWSRSWAVRSGHHEGRAARPSSTRTPASIGPAA